MPSNTPTVHKRCLLRSPVHNPGMGGSWVAHLTSFPNYHHQDMLSSTVPVSSPKAAGSKEQGQSPAHMPLVLLTFTHTLGGALLCFPGELLGPLLPFLQLGEGQDHLFQSPVLEPGSPARCRWQGVRERANFSHPCQGMTGKESRVNSPTLMPLPQAY